ncbi:cytoplasmic tRNA 2-thiolation protein 2-A isoform X2 [Pieris brassicae]|nr:cytoplasmic tRNA 2-thiolation protein 2-A isoform X2 [Pieris brassicae]
MLCKKCNSEGTLVIRKVYFFCDACFIANIIHKFRACIGKNTKFYDNKTLICLSGDISSTVLLDLVMNGITLNTHKKLRISPVFLHVNGIVSTDDSVCNFITNQCKKYNVDLISMNISSMITEYKNYNEADTTVKNNNFRMPTINNFINKISPSAEKDFLSRIRQKVLYKMAKDLECNSIFTSETNTKLSAKLLSNIVMGRGSQIENDIGFADCRDKDVKLLRPMRDITDEELNHYVRIRHLSFVDTSVSEIDLQSLITNFISDLEINSPATISTICKTADKISSADDNTGKPCRICQNNLKTKLDKLTATDATAFSKVVSSGEYNASLLTHNFECVTKMEVFPHIFEELCYSCSKNYYEFKTNILMH